LLVLLVVKCPLQCCFADRCGPQSAAEPCACCAHHNVADADAESPPRVPERSDACPCSDCFCTGAITSASTDAQLGMDDATQLLWSFVVVADAVRLSIPLGQLSANTFFLPLISSGHRVRAALSSWQI
jgi:hypothetical protein